jgi:hypothetical protein
MPTLHTIYRCGQVSHVAIPKVYNISGLAACENGSRKKIYSLNGRAKRTIQSSLVRQWHERKNNLTFLTFTFRNDQNTEKIVCDQKLMNKYFSALIDNFKKSYGLHSYVWVSERTKQQTIHYHVVCDFPKLKKKEYEVFCQYCRESFKDYLEYNSIVVDHLQQYSNVGLPSRYDKKGVSRGSVVRNLQAVMVYVSGYLKKSDREEQSGRIYAISRNILQKPTKTFNFGNEINTGFRNLRQSPKQTYTHEFCSVDYYACTVGFDDYFLQKQAQKVTFVTSDYNRKHETKRTFLTEKRRQNANKAIVNSEQQSKIDGWDWGALFQPSVYNESIELEMNGSHSHTVTNQKLTDFLRFCEDRRLCN